MRGTVLLGVACLCYGLPALAQDDPVLASRAEYRQAMQAYKEQNVDGFLEHARRAAELRPDHGGVMYALASAYAIAGDTDQALGALGRFAALGYFADVAADSDLTRLRGAPGFERVRRQIEANERSVVKSTVAFSIPEPDLLTEGIAYDAVTRRFFVGSVHHRKILQVDRDGRATEFVGSGQDSLWAPLGMRVDSARRVLWVAAAAVPQMLGFDSAQDGRSGLFRYDLGSGRLTGRFLIPHDSVGHLLGDLTVARSGDVYASDSRAPIVWRLRAGIDSLEPFVRSPLILSAQGLALTSDERALYLADYARGILRIDLASRSALLIPRRPNVLAIGIDGLYLVGNRLIGIQNGMEPHRVVALSVSARGDSLIGLEVLERRHPAHAEPTLGVMVGRELYYIANSQWERFGETGTVERPDELAFPTVLRLRL
jgi:sugar lactone lactonase YvrE